MLMSFLGDLGLQVAGGLVNSFLGKSSADQAFERQKELMDYQMKLQEQQYNKYTSPQAQVRNLAAAGINPAVAMGNQSPVFSSVPNAPTPGSVSPALFGIGTTSLNDLAQYLLAKAEAKKVGVESKNIDVETESKKFELELSKFFSAPEKVANITLAWKNVMLKDDEHNINEWKKATEKALSQLKGIERDSAQKLFENMDTVIQQENKQREEDIKLTQEKQKTEGTLQSANLASAKASSAQADLTSSQKKYQDIVNDIKASGKTFELENLIRSYQAENRVNDASAEQAYTMLERYRQLNENDKNAAAKYLNYMFWFFKEQMPNLPVVPFMKVGK